jgi:serine/threonine protein kinase/N-acetylneuraminic acid mutarotase
LDSTLVGRTLGHGKYQLLSLIGRGGMSSVYEAEHVTMRRRVAVKVLDPLLTRRPDFVQRFHREVETIAHLDHPNILQVYDSGEDDGLLYLVMLLVRGGTLKERLQRYAPPWPPRQVLRLAEQILAALDAAHEQGVIHRDIKPDNILLHGEKAYLADFGIAKLMQGDPGLTAIGAFVGTPEYAAPEQVLALPLDIRSDLYSFGVVLYQLLVGQVPFTGDSPMSVALQHVHGRLPQPLELNAELSPPIAEVLLRALAREREDRYASGLELSEALRQKIDQVQFEQRQREQVTRIQEPEHLVRPVTPPAPTPEPTAVPEATAMAETIVVASSPSSPPSPPSAPPPSPPPAPAAAPPPPSPVAAAPAFVEVPRAAPVEPPAERPRRSIPVLPLIVGAVVVIAALALLLIPRLSPSTVVAEPTALTTTAPTAETQPVSKPTAVAKPVVAATSAPVATVVPAPTVAPTAAPAKPTAPPPTVAPLAVAPTVAPPTVAAPAAPVAPVALAGPRFLHTANTLKDGRILVVGGKDDAGIVASAELFDPVAGTIKPAASPLVGVANHTASVLPDGKVLIVGGESKDAPFSPVAEVYEPSSNMWTPAGKLTDERSQHTATLLNNGQVLVAGGQNSHKFLASAELYDPVSNAWLAAAPMKTARSSHTSTLLRDGRVLVAGGFGAENSAEIYDPAANSWTSAGTLVDSRLGHTATLLADGQVLLVGGSRSEPAGYLASAERYDPSANHWAGAASLAHARDRHTATLLPDGQVLVAGGKDRDHVLSNAERYDPSADRWTDAGNLSIGRWLHSAALLGAGQVLILGGKDDSRSLSGTERYDPATRDWIAGPD